MSNTNDMHNSCKKNSKLNTKQMENTLWLMWLLTKMRSQTKMSYNFALLRMYIWLILRGGEAQASFHICENTNFSGIKQNSIRALPAGIQDYPGRPAHSTWRQMRLIRWRHDILSQVECAGRERY